MSVEGFDANKRYISFSLDLLYCLMLFSFGA